MYLSIFLFVIFGIIIRAETSEKPIMYESLLFQTESVDVLAKNKSLNSELISSQWNQELTPIWGDESLIFSSVPSNKFGLEVDVIGDREWIGVWTDERDGNRDIYMQNYQLPRRRGDMETGRD